MHASLFTRRGSLDGVLAEWNSICISVENKGRCVEMNGEETCMTEDMNEEQRFHASPRRFANRRAAIDASFIRGTPSARTLRHRSLHFPRNIATRGDRGEIKVFEREELAEAEGDEEGRGRRNSNRSGGMYIELAKSRVKECGRKLEVWEQWKLIANKLDVGLSTDFCGYRVMVN